jgi:hypothetical protein
MYYSKFSASFSNVGQGIGLIIITSFLLFNSYQALSSEGAVPSKYILYLNTENKDVGGTQTII